MLSIRDLEAQLEFETKEYNNRKNKLLNEIERCKKLEGLTKTLKDINGDINSNNIKPGTHLPNYDDLLKNHGFKLLDSARSAQLGSTLSMLKNTPAEILALHRQKIDDTDDYDNYYELYDLNQKKYIIGCSRCLQLWSHTCETRVYELECSNV